MSTRSAIIVHRPAGDYQAIYCHSDGYYSFNGRRLMEHWHGLRPACALVALGDLSSLGKVIGQKHDFDWRSKLHEQASHAQRQGEDWGEAHARLKAELPQAKHDWCLAYGRDRGQHEAFGGKFATLSEVIEWEADMMTQYIYLFDHETWWTRDVTETDQEGTWCALMDALKRDEDTVKEGPIKVGPTPYLAGRSARLHATVHPVAQHETTVSGTRRPLIL